MARATIDPVQPPKPRLAERALASLRDFRPSVITNGASITPLLLLASVDAVDGLDVRAVALLLPEIRDYFGVNIFTITLITSITTVLGIAMAVPIGYLADRVNRIWLTVAGGLVLGVFMILTGFAWSIVALATFRLGAGIGRVIGPSEQALLADYYPTQARAAVFSFLRAANRVGSFVAPLVAGILASIFFWQAPFLILGLPAIVFAIVIALKLKEPARGEQERREMGASEDVAKTEEAPPSWTESWRIAKNIRTIRRFWYALPFLVGSLQAIFQIMSIYYDEVFGLGPGARGAIGAFDEPIEIVGLIVGAGISTKLLMRRPGRVITYLGLIAVSQAVAYALIAIAPFLWLAVGLSYARGAASAVLVPALLALTTMVIPPRVRGFVLGTFAWFAIPGVLVAPVFGAITDAVGPRIGLLVMAPVFLVGALIITSSGSSVDADIRAARAAAMAGHASRKAKREGTAKLLVVRDLDVHYDAVQVLFNVDFDVTEGEIVALLGTNGAGKSTLLRAISGTQLASNGAIFCDGEDITHLPPSAHAARGIVQVPGGKGIFPTLTVAENLRMASWLHRREPKVVKANSEKVLEFFPVLRQRLDQPAGNLSGGEQQMLALGQAFLSRPRLLMIDELSLGLAPAVIEQLLGIVRAIHEQGTTIILVEQSVNVALTVAQRAVFMEKGEVRFSGPTAELMQRTDVLRSVFLKGSAAARGSVSGKRAGAAPDRVASDEIALEATGLTKRFGGVLAVSDVDLTLEDGKIIGLIGPNGAGKTTLFDIITGFLAPDGGTVKLFGEDITDLAPDERAKAGLVRSFQDARLFPSLTVTENIALALERHLETRSTLAAALHLPNVSKSEANIERRVDRLVRLMGLVDFRDKFVKELSTGSRRIVDLACIMACDPRVLLLDEPSSGIAQKETEELGPLLQRIKWETGCSILIIEHDMPLISSVSDELIALDLGTVVTRGTPEEVLVHPAVVSSYLGTSEEVIRRSGQVT